MSKPLEQEFQWYLDNQDDLVDKYVGRFIVIKDCEVLGDYESKLEAINETEKHHELGTFLVMKCEAGSEDYTQIFHSRVAFV